MSIVGHVQRQYRRVRNTTTGWRFAPMRRRGEWGVTLAALGLGALSAVAAPSATEPNPHVWKTKVSSVAVFKNGLGFFVREGDVQLRDGWCMADEIPPATFGALAIYPTDEKQLVDLVGAGPGETIDFDGIDQADDLDTRRARLSALVNLKIALTYRRNGSDALVAGRLESADGAFAVVDRNEGLTAVPLGDIRRVQLAELPLRVHVSGAGPGRPETTRLGMAYLRKGITWIPEYSFRLLDDETGELVLRGTLVNDAEDLIHCDVQFVVGVPHFVHTDYLTPISVGQVIRTIGAAVAPAGVQSQIMSRAAIASNFVAADQFDEVRVQPMSGAQAGGATTIAMPAIDEGRAADYSVYTARDLTVRTGEKAIVTLFRQRVPYSHIYRWQVPGRPEHFLRLENGGGSAWTTGPCLTVRGASALSEDLLTYTPAGGKCELPVATAVNLAAENREWEHGRILKQHEPRNEVFLDLVTLRGELKLRSFEPRPVSVSITVPVQGKPVSADGGRMTTDSSKLVLRERTGSMYWSIELQPGETKTLAYEYERYVPSN